MSIIVQAKAKLINGVISNSVLVPKTINASLLSCLPVTIVDEASNILATVAAGGEYEVQNVDIIDQNSNVIQEVAPGGTYNVIVFDGIDGGLPGTTFTNSIVGGTP